MTADELQRMTDDDEEQYAFNESWKDVQANVESMKTMLTELKEDVTYMRTHHAELTKRKVLELRNDKDDASNLLAFFLTHGHHMFHAPKHKKRRVPRKPSRDLQATEILP